MDATLEEEVAKPNTSVKKNDYHVYPQLIAGLMANFTLLSAGMAVAWPSLALPRLMDEDAEFYVTSNEGAWIVAALQIGAIIGPILPALLVDRMGRKWFLYSCGLPYLLCWILIYYIESFAILFLARFISGIGVGGVFAAVPMYLGEIAEVRVRGALGAMLSGMLNFGTLSAYILGALVDAKPLALFNLVPIAIFLLVFCWMPESPYYYLRKNEKERAKKSLMALRKSKHVEKELAEMTDLIKKESEHRGRITELITVPANRRATIIVWLLVTAQQCSGFVGIIAYAVEIFESTATVMPSEGQVILTGGVAFVSGLAAICAIDRLGKRPLFIISSSGVCLCLLAMSACFIFQDELRAVEKLHWLPLAVILLFHIFFSFGLGPIPYAVLAEVYPTTIKATAATASSIYGSVLGAVVSKLFQVIADGFGYEAVFFTCCTIELVIMLIVVFILPETRGKTFKEIQEELENKDTVSKDNRV